MRLNKVMSMILAMLLLLAVASCAFMEGVEEPVEEVRPELGETAVSEPVEEVSNAEASDIMVGWPGYNEIHVEGFTYEPEFHTAHVGDVLVLTSMMLTEGSSAKETWTVDATKIASFGSNKTVSQVKCKAGEDVMLYLNTAGTVTVRVSAKGETACVKLHVIDPQKARYIGLKNVDPDEFTELYVQNPKTGKIGRMVFKVNAQLFNSLGDKVTDAAAARSIRWISSNPRVARVYRTSVPGQAKVYVRRTGDVTITAKLRFRSVSFDLHVYDTVSPDRIFFVDEYGDETKTLRMEVGERFWLGWIIDGDSDAVLRADSFTYNSHHTSIATVDREGVVTALRRGNVRIDVKSFNGKKATLNVKIR